MADFGGSNVVYGVIFFVVFALCNFIIMCIVASLKNMKKRLKSVRQQK